MEERQVNLTEMASWLNHHFSTDELYDLCRLLHIDYEDLAGSRKSAKVRELVVYFARRNTLADLFQAGQQLRPELDWSQWDFTDDPNLSDPSTTSEGMTVQENCQELRIEAPSIDSVFALDCNFLQFRKFMQEAFTLDELLNFINRSEDFKEFGFDLSANASHNSVTRELLAYAQRHEKMVLLLGQLEDAMPDLYEKHGPFIEAGQLRINVTFVIKGDATRLKALDEKSLGKEFEQKILHVSEQAFFQAI
jgi:hypothetical protein